MRLLCIPHGSGAHKPKADVVVPIVGIVVVPIRGTGIPSRIVPAPAAFHAVTANVHFFQPFPFLKFARLRRDYYFVCSQPTKIILFTLPASAPCCGLRSTPLRFGSPHFAEAGLAGAV